MNDIDMKPWLEMILNSDFDGAEEYRRSVVPKEVCKFISLSGECEGEATADDQRRSRLLRAKQFGLLVQI